MSTVMRNSEIDLSKIVALIFDLDGTLIKSTVDFRKIKTETLSRLTELGVKTHDLSENMKTYEIMDRLKANIEKHEAGLSYSKILTEITIVWNRVELENIDKIEAIPRAKDTLKSLKNKHIKLGVITRGCRAYAIEALKRTQLLSLIDLILARDDVQEAKPSPEPLLLAMSTLDAEADETMMVGDTIEDAICAQKARVTFIGVLTGNSDGKALLGGGAIKVLRSIADLF